MIEPYYQVEAMREWEKKCPGFHSELFGDLKDWWRRLAPNYTFTEEENYMLSNLMLEFSFHQIKAAMNSVYTRLHLTSERVSHRDYQTALNKIKELDLHTSDQNICIEATDYLLKILENRGIVMSENDVYYQKPIIENALERGILLESMKRQAKVAKSLFGFVWLYL